MNWIAWCFAIGTPKVLRSNEYFKDSSKQRCASPVAPKGKRLVNWTNNLENSGSTRCYWRSRLIKSSHRNLETLTLSDEYVLGRNSHILECDSSCVTGSLSHINLLSARGHSRPITFNDESCECFRCWGFWIVWSSCQHEIPVGDSYKAEICVTTL